ncbi:Hypothetical protein I595_3584 [Croceitalea dokdonensis DOKDO 023]|uniref:Uncharacterized protein n=1 Tax=Croceitalea dokdonensis DOKDO 023 TaxID=1300341 RepID=A0A0P7AMJ5_9FLAO|nr:Hypothetical protein I595_3584 [Croceitalea dokdonensis DOKDO 023]
MLHGAQLKNRVLLPNKSKILLVMSEFYPLNYRLVTIKRA